MKMQNAVSGVERKVLGNFHRLWAFLFGFIYYGSKGAWGWAFISFLTANGLFLIMPLWNKSIIRGHYENAGWRVIDPQNHKISDSQSQRGQPQVTRHTDTPPLKRPPR